MTDGRAEMYAQAETVVWALERAGLTDLATELTARVTRQPLERIAECDEGVLAFKPYVELLLLHVRHCATAPHRSCEERRAEILWTLSFAGF